MASPALAGAADLVTSTLERYGALTRAEFGRYLPRREPFRHLYSLLADYPARGGKMLRSSLCIATARAFGATADAAVRSAAAIELLHNAMLIHDDIEDGSESRRGSPALHVIHGVPMAINAGDGLSLLSLRPLIENAAELGPTLTLRVLEETERVARESAEGQAIELGWRRDNALGTTEADYLALVLQKTCWLMAIHPSRVGALIGTSDSLDLDDFIRFGFFLGAAFQIQDDLLNLRAEGEAYGKERDGDLWEGKRTLVLIRALAAAGPRERERIGRLLGLPRDEKPEAEVAWLRRFMEESGALDHADRLARGLAGAALHEFSLLYGGLPASRDLAFIEALPTWVIERRH